MSGPITEDQAARVRIVALCEKRSEIFGLLEAERALALMRGSDEILELLRREK